jgi:hypothetical protein
MLALTLSIPLWMILSIACWAVAIAVMIKDARSSSGGFIPPPPMLGCGALLLAMVATLALALVHAWGWL